MFTRITLIVALCLAAVAFGDSSSEEHGHRLVLGRSYGATAPKPRYAAPRRSYGGSSSEEANYQFAWQVLAGGPQRSAYGDDSGERRYGDSHTSEFGHAEARKGDDTKGKYFVQLPDGRLQTVEYYVNGDSGYIAKVSYDGKSDEKRAY